MPRVDTLRLLLLCSSYYTENGIDRCSIDSHIVRIFGHTASNSSSSSSSSSSSVRVRVKVNGCC